MVVACAKDEGTKDAELLPANADSAAIATEDDAKGPTSDPFGVTLTSTEIAEGEAWEASGQEEEDIDVDDGDTTAEFEKLPVATDDEDAPLLNTQSLVPQGLVQTSSSPLVCRPTGTIRQAACWARGVYKGNIKIAMMDGKMVEVTVYCHVQKGKELAKAAGKTLTVSSGWRSVDSQRVLYAKYKAGRGAVAAPPGRSHHNCGHAIDFGGSARTSGWLRSNSPKFAFTFVPIKGESWHFENWTVGPKVPR